MQIGRSLILSVKYCSIFSMYITYVQRWLVITNTSAIFRKSYKMLFMCKYVYDVYSSNNFRKNTLILVSAAVFGNIAKNCSFRPNFHRRLCDINFKPAEFWDGNTWIKSAELTVTLPNATVFRSRFEILSRIKRRLIVMSR